MKYLTSVVRVVFLLLFLFLAFSQRTTLWLGIFALSLVLAVFFGRLYCGYVCPMNTIMVFKEKFIKKGTLSTPKWLKSGKLPWVFLILSVLIMVLSKRIMKVNVPILLIWLMLSFIVTLFYKPYVFHNYICPFGALQELAGKVSYFSKRVDKNVCIGCKRCEKVCQANAIKVSETDKKAKINEKLCHQCNKCTDVCPTRAISYKRECDF